MAREVIGHVTDMELHPQLLEMGRDSAGAKAFADGGTVLVARIELPPGNYELGWLTNVGGVKICANE